MLVCDDSGCWGSQVCSPDHAGRFEGCLVSLDVMGPLPGTLVPFFLYANTYIVWVFGFFIFHFSPLIDGC